MTVSDMEEERFCNLVVEVSSSFRVRNKASRTSADSPTARKMLGYCEVQDKPIVEIWVTDYSTHNQLFDFTKDHQRAKRGVTGRRIFMVTFWNGAAGDLSDFEEGSLRVLDNVRMKVNAAGVLQGNISTHYEGSGQTWRPAIRPPNSSHRDMVDGLISFVSALPRTGSILTRLLLYSVVELRTVRRWVPLEKSQPTTNRMQSTFQPVVAGSGGSFAIDTGQSDFSLRSSHQLIL